MFKKRKADPQAIEELRHVSFFDGFSDDELRRVVELAEEVEAEDGAVLMEQGRVGQECYVILEGSAGVIFGGEHGATLQPGSMVGEMALVDHRPRSASVVAETPMRLLAFDTKAFKQLLEEMPKAHDRVMQLLSARLRDNAG
jgi:CRP/FNR family transcriptional regulator, cyclic AMP receptor protein